MRASIGLSIIALGFSSGLPLALVGSTLQIRLAEAGVAIENIGLVALLTLPYSIKFLVAPIFDRFALPFLGLRRGWMLALQLALASLVALAGFLSPAEWPFLLASISLGIACCSALFDIVVDAYRTEITPTHTDGGWMSSLHVFGYRLGMVVSGALALYLVDTLSWRGTYLFLATLFLLCTLATLLGNEPQRHVQRVSSLLASVIEPLRNYWQRPGSGEVLVFLFLFKASEFLAVALRSPFLIELGFAKAEIATFNKIYGLIALICGGFAGGALLSRIGIKMALLSLGTFQAITFLLFSVLASRGYDTTLLKVAVATEEFANGMVTSALVAFMMSLCSRDFTATQYALLSSLVNLPRTVLGSMSGYFQTLIGWKWYFVACSILALPSLFIVAFRWAKWQVVVPLAGD